MKAKKVSRSAAPRSPKVHVWVAEAKVPQPHRGGWLALAGMGTLVLLIWGSWVAVLLIINPGSVRWLSALLPQWGDFSLTDPSVQTMAEIEAEAHRAGLSIGSPVLLPTRSLQQSPDFLLPILAAQSRCRATGSSCRQIAELRVYHPQTATAFLTNPRSRFELLDRLKVTGPEELMAIAPLAHAKLVNQGSSRKLPLTDLALFEAKGLPPGVWLTLSGQWQRGSTAVLYGQIIHYDPLHQRLQQILPWTSPANHLPDWRQETGSTHAELVVDQTIGLEPQFQLYQVQLPDAPGRPIRLEAVTLSESILSDRPYTQGLLLARHGLWSPALKLLQAAKQGSDRWPAAAQAQLDLVALHARVTQAQAARDWASPTQQIAALLMDGQWAKALTLLRSAHQDGYDIKSLLAANVKSLWKRVEAALQVNANQADVQRWGALAMAVQRDRSAAIAWLKQRSASTSLSPILALLDPLPDESIRPEGQMASNPAALNASLPSRWIGTLTPLPSVQPQDWMTPKTNDGFTLADHQTWYRVDVMGLQEDLQWRSAPAHLSSTRLNPQTLSALWQHLGFDQASSLQILSAADNTQQITATVQAIRSQGGRIQLLVAGDRLSLPHSSTPLLAFTSATIRWVTPLTTLTLAELHQQQPQPTATLVTTLEQELEAAGQTLPSQTIEATLNPSAVQSDSKTNDPVDRVSGWVVDRIEVTGEGQPEVMISVTTDDSSLSRDLIFSATGQLLYSDLQTPSQSLVTMADLENGAPPILVVRQGQSYTLQQWSVADQAFESLASGSE